MTLSNVSLFDLESFQSSVAEALGVSAEKVSLTKIHYEVSVTLSLGVEITIEKAQVAIADFLNVYQDNAALMSQKNVLHHFSTCFSGGIVRIYYIWYRYCVLLVSRAFL